MKIEVDFVPDDNWWNTLLLAKEALERFQNEANAESEAPSE